MKEKNNEFLYESPVVVIYETQVQSVICGSQGHDLPEWEREGAQDW